MNDLEFLDQLEHAAKNGGPVTFAQLDRLYSLTGWTGSLVKNDRTVAPWVLPQIVKFVEEARVHLADQVKERLKS